MITRKALSKKHVLEWALRTFLEELLQLNEKQKPNV